MINVNWAFSLQGDNWSEEDLTEWAILISNDIDLPSPLSSEIIRERKDVVFLRCPAHTDFMKNTFVFKAPFDINLNISVKNDIVNVFSNNIPQRLFQKIIDFRFLNLTESGKSPYPILGIDLLNAFTCSESILMSVMPAFMHYNDFTSKTCVIPGEYDISKWTRPVECVFELKDCNQEINIKKGDALSYFRFRQGEESVKLVKAKMPWSEIDTCAKLRSEAPFKPLSHRYKSLEDFKINNGQ